MTGAKNLRQVGVRLEPADARKIARIADRAGTTTSQLARKWIHERLEREP